jgi:hypothetical protein
MLDRLAGFEEDAVNFGVLLNARAVITTVRGNH